MEALTSGFVEEPLMHSSSKSGHNGPAEHDKPHEATWQHEAKQQLGLALPITGMMAVQLLLVLTSAAFVGHLGALQLASAQLASSLADALGQNLLMGMALGLETLGGQVVGAGQLAELGHITHLGLIVLTLLACVISIGWAFAEPLLLALGQDRTLAKEAAKYLHLLIPSLFANAWTQPLVKFLQSLGATAPLAWASSIALLLHLPSNCLQVLHLLPRVGANRGPDCDKPRLLPYLRHPFGAHSHQPSVFSLHAQAQPETLVPESVALPQAWLLLRQHGGVSSCWPAESNLEYVAFDIIYLLAGLLPDPYRLVSALSVAMNTTFLCASTYVGLSNAITTRVATELGRGSVPGAQKAVRVGLGWSLVVGAGATVLMLALHRQWPLLFIDGNDRQLLDLCAGLMLFASFYFLGDSVQTVAGGVLRGCGRQNLGAALALSSYYGIALPAAVIGGFVFKWGVWGIFGGMFVGTISQLVFLLTAVAWTDWNRQAQNAREGAFEEQEGSPLA